MRCVALTDSEGGHRLIAGVGLASMLAAGLGEILVQGRPSLITVFCFLVTLPFLFHFLARQQRLFVALCGIAALLLVLQGSVGDLRRALVQSAGLAMLLVALVWLRVAAMRSRSLTIVSRSVAQQPRAVRHFGLALAAHLIGILLNVGIFGLMAKLVSDAKAAGGDERDMALSILRGFGFTMLWAPTAAAQVVITAVVPGVTWETLAPRAAVMAMSLIALSWLFSCGFGRRRGENQPRPQPIDISALGVMLVVITSMIAAVLAFHSYGDYGLMVSVTLASLLVGTLWVLAQRVGRRDDEADVGLRRRLSGFVGYELSAAAREIMTLSGAGFLGIAVSVLIPQSWLNAVVSPLADHSLLLYLAVTVAVPAISAAGLNPLISASLIGGGFAAIPPDHLEPAKLAFALASGWAVAYGVSPFTTGAIVLSQALRRSPEVLALRWNGPFTIFALIYVCFVVAAVTLLT